MERFFISGELTVGESRRYGVAVLESHGLFRSEFLEKNYLNKK